MKLNSITLKNFRCFEDSLEMPIHDMTIFIGENDAGKSSIIDALELFLLGKMTKETDYHIDNETQDQTKKCYIETKWSLTKNSPEFLKKLSCGDLKLIIKREDSINENGTYLILKEAYTDDDLNLFESDQLKKDGLIALAKKLQIEVKTTHKVDDLKSFIQDVLVKEVDRFEKVRKYVDIPFSKISAFLPILQRYASSDYGQPMTLIGKTLETLYKSGFYNDDNDLKIEFKKFQEKMESELDKNIENSLKTIIQEYNPKVTEIKGNYNIDFTSGFRLLGLSINTGTGLKSIDSKGQGSKKRLHLAILKWDREVTKQIDGDRPILKCFDEPDANLHYQAQKQLYDAICDENKQNDIIQTIICTHSLGMIDKAPASKINHLLLDENECSTVSYVNTRQENDIRDFLDQLSDLSGLKNSSLFYEKCFLLVEGESELNALPTMYYKFYDRRMIEDGIQIINLESNGGWVNFLKLLSSNKQNCTAMFLDQDTQEENSPAKITPKKLKEIGFRENFVDTNVVFCGNKEFEDEYIDTVLLKVLNQDYRRQDDSEWTKEHIAEIREEEKFSKYLPMRVKRESSITDRYIGKPEIAHHYAHRIRRHEIAQMVSVIKVFDLIRRIAL